MTVLANIADYQTWTEGQGSLALQLAFVAQLPQRKRYSDFWEACSCLLIPGPHFEKYLCFALLCYISVAFSPQRIYLSASHTAFRTPRLLLTQQLPSFTVYSQEETECLVWMWLVLIDAWRATEVVNSETTTNLSRQFAELFPSYCSWPTKEDVLKQFFFTDAILAATKSSFIASEEQDASRAVAK